MKEKSFTIIELLVVIAIIGLLSSIVLVSTQGAKNRAQVGKALAFSGHVQRSLGAYVLAAYNFNNGTAEDSSGNNNNGTISGAIPAIGIPELGNALSFDGVNSSVTVTDPVNLRVQTYTIEFWIKYTNFIAGWGQIIAKIAPGTDRAPGVWANPGKTCLHWKHEPGNAGPGCLGPNGDNTEFSLNQWYHIAGVKSGTIFKIFINGEQKGPNYSVPDPITQGAGNFYIGKTAFPPFNGTIDEVRVYGEALSLSEIQKHYAEGLESHSLVKK